MLDPVVHAALFVVAAWLIQLLAKAIGFDLGNDIANALAQIIVDYILSLFGLALYARLFVKFRARLQEGSYKPPFT